MNRFDDIRKENLDQSSVARLDYRKEQREKQMKESELNRKKMDLDAIETEIERNQRRRQEIHYILRRLEAEQARAKSFYEKELREDQNVGNNLEKETAENESLKTETNDKLSEVNQKIKQLKDQISKLERDLEQEEKKHQELERSKDKGKRNKEGIISRLIRIFEREKTETALAKRSLDLLNSKIANLQRESRAIKGDITILENKLSALKRNMR
jgi:chromosome segregation protein